MISSQIAGAETTIGCEGSGGKVGGARLFKKGDKAATAALEQQAKKLKVRGKAMLEALLGAIPEAPKPLLRRLHFLCTKRIMWPAEHTLFASERGVLRRQPDGSHAATELSPPRLAIGLLLSRVVVLQLLLHPKETGLTAAPSARGAANLRMLAALAHYLSHLAMLRLSPSASNLR